ncbi:hypothetical protein XENOCAPTIV_010599, partial [Xenoophorus captivus]
MDDFVCDKLKEWGLAELIKTFRDEDIDSEVLYDLKDGDIDKLIPKMGPRLKFKKRLNQLKAQQKEEVAHEMTEVLPSTSDTGKRRRDPRCESSKETPAVKRQRETNSSAETEARIFNDVKNKMGKILAILNNQNDTNLNTFLKTKIRNLETEKKELVGVFGKTGAGKTSLINAVIEEKELLPSGNTKACTSVMIKVEANRHNEIYEAVVEFISPEEWEDEMGSLLRTIEKGDQEMDNNDDDDDNDDYHEAVDKLSALYDEEWKERSCEQLMEPKCFKEISEFLRSEQKTLTFIS